MNKNNKIEQFPNRANLKEKEIEIQKFWKEINLLKLINKDKKEEFLFLSGPPYANGNIHIGHALNKVLKDFSLRFASLRGKKIEYFPGWDMHGLPIANIVTKLFPNIKNPILFRKKCLEYATSQMIIQKKQFERLGLLMDFSKKYLTSDYKFIISQLKIFSDLIQQNKISRKLKPVLWSWSSNTALAETEIIYKEKNTDSVFFTLQIINNKEFFNCFFVAWTTSIWTIPENNFIAVDKDMDYLLIFWNEKKLVVSSSYSKKLIGENEKFKVLKKFKGADLENIEYSHPYLHLTSKVILADHVTEEHGTGVVHIAPAFGLEDFVLAQKLNKKILVALDSKGFFNENAQDKKLIGKFYQDSEKIIIENLKNSNNLLKIEKILHQYPYDWRTEKPVIYRATSQLYFRTPKINLEKINWKPNWTQKKMKMNIDGRDEWCISRQRNWGIPIPTFVSADGKLILETELIDCVIKKINELKSENFWWEKKITEILPKELIKKYNLIGKKFETFDVWFDSGSVKNFIYPEKTVDLIWEGNDQFRGWFNSLLVINDASGKLLFKTIASHGFVNDEKGLKMSKSKGNVVDPLEICNSLGADVLRLWVASSDYFNDINLGKELLKKTQKTYLKTRITIKFLINNTLNYDHSKKINEDLHDLDYVLLLRFSKLIKEVEQKFNSLEFHLGWKKIFNFINIYLSNFYFDFIKKKLYFDDQESKRRLMIQSVLSFILQKLIIVMAPIMPHTCEEAFQFINNRKNSSVHLQSWPLVEDTLVSLSQTQKTNVIIKFFFFEKIKKALNVELEKNLQDKKITSNKNLKVSIYLKNNLEIFGSENEWIEFAKEFDIETKLNKETNSLKNKKIILNDSDFTDFLKIEKLNSVFFEVDQEEEILFKIEQL